MEGVVNEASDNVSEIAKLPDSYRRNSEFARMSVRSPEVAGIAQAGSYKLINGAERDFLASQVSGLNFVEIICVKELIMH